MYPFTSGTNGGAGCRYGFGEPGKSPPLNDSPVAEGGGDKGANPATALIILIGWGAIGVIDRLCCGVRSGLPFGDTDPVDLLEYVEAGLVITFDHGLLFILVGVVLRLVADETDEVAGEDALRLLYHDWSS